MRIPDADEAFPAKAAHLIGVIRNDVHLFDKFDVLGSGVPVPD